MEFIWTTWKWMEFSKSQLGCGLGVIHFSLCCRSVLIMLISCTHNPLVISMKIFFMEILCDSVRISEIFFPTQLVFGIQRFSVLTELVLYVLQHSWVMQINETTLSSFYRKIWLSHLVFCQHIDLFRRSWRVKWSAYNLCIWELCKLITFESFDFWFLRISQRNGNFLTCQSAWIGLNLIDFQIYDSTCTLQLSGWVEIIKNLSTCSFSLTSVYLTLSYFPYFIFSTVNVHQLNSSTSKIIDFMLESTTLNGRRRIGEFADAADKSSPSDTNKSFETDEQSDCNKNAVYARINGSALKVQWNWTMREQKMQQFDAVETVDFRWVIKTLVNRAFSFNFSESSAEVSSFVFFMLHTNLIVLRQEKSS